MAAKPHIGFIGLGVMGAPMTARLIRAGYRVTVSTRTRARAAELLDKGAIWADTASEVAKDADVVITMLPDTPDVNAVGQQILGAARRGTFWIDMSTIAASAWRDIVEHAAAQGIRAVDAPVSGGEKGAIGGTLTIMVGAAEDDFQAVTELLGNFGTPALIGGPGAGQVAKMCNQILTAGTIGLVAEALTVAASSDVDPGRVREALLGGFAASRILEVHGQRMLNHDYKPGFQSKLHRKDVDIALTQAAGVGVSAPFTAVSARLFDGAISRGDAELDSIVVYRDYCDLAIQASTSS
ncbi:NAD(P)-dependent oxidoreductase [Mycolicibacterium goodii]|uniref:NAD(P)-dependent oxidoreductase n=1 Tax=Mycolicibacterium goodii TaxID=134601 RepID=UPI001304758F|nr:NAD(P)-dependent oxidoreductase [Mycolicibacterium goodii]